MADIIKLLPDSVANQIAAGEVVKRPASVIKELVENSVDAGATRIDIFIKDGGRTLIQVVDNGKGMSPIDARMAFERHATSKITVAQDLYSLHTMGFRGEALPSICAISQVELRTRPSSGQMGTRLLINGSKVESQTPDICDAGTNIMVRNLFYNVPARRKFMGSDSVETGHILREFERLALVNNNLHLSIDTGTRHIELRPGNFKQRINDLFRNSLKMQLIPVDVETSLVKIHGFVSRPEFARRRNALQYLMANGRNMYHPKFHKAILTAFDSLIAKDTQPCYFLKIEVAPDTIDVNIHPTKHEIKFENEQQIWTILHTAVRSSLGKNAAVPSIDFESDVLPVDPAVDNVVPDPPVTHVPRDYNPFRSSPTPPKNWEALYDSFMGRMPRKDESFQDMGDMPSVSVERFVEPEQPADAPLPEMDGEGIESPICLQHNGGYIVTGSRDGLIIIDQHRAHVRILFERYMKRMRNEEQVSQGIMFPDSINLSERQLSVLDEIGEDLHRMGFVIEHDADDAALIRICAHPAMLHNADVSDVVLGILDSVSDKSVNFGSNGVGSESMKRRMALVMARGGAIQRGRRLTADEMEHIVGELFALSDPAIAPDGNPVYVVFSQSRLDALFR